MVSLTPPDFLRLVVDEDRLAVLGLAAVGPLDVAEVAHVLGFPVGEVRRAVGKLVEAGLLDAELNLDRAVLRELALALPGQEPVAPEMLTGPWTPDEREVLGRYFEGSRLRKIPAPGTKRRVVLERLAQEFQPGIRYREKDVNSILVTYHPDFAALRRYLVDEGLLTRADGAYWRSGGRVET
jgi:hypothetical protein